MKKMILLTCCTLLILPSLKAHAGEPIPRKDFIEITEKVMDGLDELVAATSSYGYSRYQRQTTIADARTKLQATMKKYDRYLPNGKWPLGGMQNSIFIGLSSCLLQQMIVDMSFQTAEITNNFDDWKKNCEEFDNSVREVKETYRKYKQGKK